MTTRRQSEQHSSVYVLWAEGTHLFKIGYTKGAIGDRTSAIAAMSPLPLRIVAQRPGGRAEELDLHIRLRHYRAHGEWFALPEEAVWWLLAQCGISPEDAR